MTSVIVFENTKNPARVSIMYPTGDVAIPDLIERFIDKTKPYYVMDRSQLPNNDNDYFDAWTYDLNSASVIVDMPMARNIHRNQLRSKRTILFEALDVKYMRALERNDTLALGEIAGEKQKLRDVTADPRIEAAQSAAELRALTIEVLLE